MKDSDTHGKQAELQRALYERQQRSHFRLEFLKRLVSRKPLWQSYLDGEINLNLHIGSRRRDDAGAGSTATAIVRVHCNDRVLPDLLPGDGLSGTAVEWHDLPMLVFVRQALQQARPTRSWVRITRCEDVWLDGLDQSAVIGRDAVQVSRDVLACRVVAVLRELKLLRSFSTGNCVCRL